MKYTITSHYSATGEGVTINILFVYADNEDDAKKQFSETFDPYWTIGAHIEEGYVVDSEISDIMLNENIKKQLSDERCRQIYHATLHYNYS